MVGTVIGDIVGSIYEFNNIKTKNFVFFGSGCEATDDSIMAIAVADAIMESQDSGKPFKDVLRKKFVEYGRKYPWPMGGYGGRFKQWLVSSVHTPYNSCGNGSAMRVAACGFAAKTVEEARELAKQSAEITHNHPDGIAGAQAVAEAIFLAKSGCSKAEIANAVKKYYPVLPDIDVIRPTYGWGAVCSNTVPEAVSCFLQSTDFEDAIRNAISIGGDSDTIGAIVGGIAEAYYGVKRNFAFVAKTKLPVDLRKVLMRFEERYQA